MTDDFEPAMSRPMMKCVHPKFLRIIMWWIASRGPAMCIEYGKNAQRVRLPLGVSFVSSWRTT